MKSILNHALSFAIGILVSCTVLVGNLNAQPDTEGKEFWFTFLENYADTELQLEVFLSSKYDATGVLEIPAASWSQNFNVTANQTTTINIPIGRGYPRGSGNQSTAIHLTSDEDVNVFAMNYKVTTSDGSIILPVDALGDDYIVAAYNASMLSEFSLVGVEDGTVIDVVFPNSTTDQITLNRGQVYAYQSGDDYTGTRVTSTDGKVFACLSGETCTNIPPGVAACDHIFDQMFPVRAWGRKYISSPIKSRTGGDRFRILAARDGSQISVNGANVTTLNARQYHEMVIKPASVIESNYPICVVQYCHSQDFDDVPSDPFMVVLSPVEQTRTDVSFHVYNFPNINNNYLNVVTKTSCINEMVLDGSSIASNFAQVPSDPTYSYAQVDIGSGSHRLYTTGTGCGFNAYVYGFGGYDSYGYSAGASLDTLNIQYEANTNCAGLGTEFYVSSTPYPIVDYDWDFDDGGKSSQAGPTHVYESGGLYTVTLVATYDNDDRDTIIREVPITEPIADASIVAGGGCENVVDFQNDSQVIMGVIASSAWNFGDGGGSSETNPSYNYSNPGTYEVILTITTENGCIDRDTFEIEIFPTPELTLAADETICYGDTIQIGAEASGGTVDYIYSWSPTTGLSDPSSAVTQAAPLSDTEYTLTVTDANGCEVSDAIYVDVLPQRFLDLGDDIEICYGDTEIIGRAATGGSPPFTYSWSPTDGLTSPNAFSTETSPEQTTEYVLTAVDSYGCVIRDTMTVVVHPLPEPVITPDGPTWFCSCDSVTLDAGDLGYLSYSWSTGETTREIVVKVEGSYTVEVVDTNGCQNISEPIEIEVTYPTAEIEIGSLDQGAPTGSIVEIPLRVRFQEHLDTCGIRLFEAEVRLRRAILAPLGDLDDAIAGDYRTINLSGTREIGSDDLATLRFTSVLGDVPETDIELVDFRWIDCPSPVDTYDGAFELTNVCRSGSIERLFFEATETTMSVAPNPASTSADIKIAFGAESLAEVYLTDLLGRRIGEILSGEFDEGELIETIDFSNVSVGSYYLVAVINGETKALQIRVEK